MSWWQRLQESDSMKNLLGIFCPPYTCAELGKNGPCGPSPSLSIVAGEFAGFFITALLRQRAVRRYQHPMPNPAIPVRQAVTRNAAIPAPLRSQPRPPAQLANKIATAAAERTI